jgi:putative holliday junction resolvase
MKYLGIDFGTKRIGLAVSDETGAFAFPKEIIPFNEKTIDTICTLVKEHNIEKIILGYSIASNGMENELMPKVEKFKVKLSTAAHTPVVLEREDFSTVEAHRYQTKAGNRDDSAAAIILQRFLDKQK